MGEISSYLIFGATGAIGSACASKLQSNGQIIFGSKDPSDLKNQIDLISEFHGVIWAQGTNIADSPKNFNTDNYQGYFADLVKRFKTKQIDILIVVDMLYEPHPYLHLRIFFGF